MDGWTGLQMDHVVVLSSSGQRPRRRSSIHLMLFEADRCADKAEQKLMDLVDDATPAII